MRFLFLSVLIFSNIFLYAENGKIIDKTAFVLPDSSIRNVEKYAPGIRTVLSAVNFYRITYLSDGFKVKGFMAIPKKKGKYPCVIYNRGGNLEFGKITGQGFIGRGLGELSANGYVVVASQYRGNDGGEGREEFGGKEVNDIINLIPLLSNVSEADTTRIGMFGWSRGGMMTYLALTKTTRIKAAVIGSGIVDLNDLLKSRPVFDSVWGNLIPDYSPNKVERLKERSAVYFAQNINKSTPMLIFQGSSDWRVPSGQVINFTNILYQVKHPFRFILYEGGDHALTEHRADYVTQMTDWFNRYLRDGKTWPSLELHGD